jgi:glycosyltransferase involved in cell wall biosynthesis
MKAMECTKNLCSIIIATYNHENYLRCAIESALMQDYEHKEVIVVDDGSTDGTANILNEYQKKIKIISNKNNGQFSAYKAGFKISNGEYLIFLDSDDILHSNAVSNLVPMFDSDTAKVHFRMEIIDVNGNSTNKITPKFLSCGALGDKLIKNGWCYNSSPGTGNIYKRKTIVRLFDNDLKINRKNGADFYLIYGSALFGQVKTCSMILASYRILNTSIQSVGFGNSNEFEEISNIYKEREINLRNLLPNLNFENEFNSVPLLKVIIVSKYFNHGKIFFSDLKSIIKYSLLDNDRNLISKIILILAIIGLYVPNKKISHYMAIKITNPMSR